MRPLVFQAPGLPCAPPARRSPLPPLPSTYSLPPAPPASFLGEREDCSWLGRERPKSKVLFSYSNLFFQPIPGLLFSLKQKEMPQSHFSKRHGPAEPRLESNGESSSLRARIPRWTSPVTPRRLMLCAGPSKPDSRDVESPHLSVTELTFSFSPRTATRPSAACNPVAAPRRPEGVPPAGVCRKALATTSAGRVQALRAAHGRSPGGTKRARLGARRFCSWKARPDAPPPAPLPSPRSGRKADPGPGASVLLRVPLGPPKDWCKGRGSATRSFPVPPPLPPLSVSHLLTPTPTSALGTHPSYIWVKPNARLCKSLEAGTDQGVKARVDGPSPVGERWKGPVYHGIVERRKPRGKEKTKKKGKQGRDAKQQC